MAEKPEEKARAGIDQLLAKAGWSVQSMAEANIHAARGFRASTNRSPRATKPELLKLPEARR